MQRSLYILGWAYVAACGLVLVRGARRPLSGAVHVQPAAAYAGPAGQWFQQVKPFCNTVEVEMAQRNSPPPATLEGAGYSAACYALGGKIDHARQVIDALPVGDRASAAGIVFDVAHPVADAGDDRSAGPIMQLVVEYWPNHYMALYHAGMAEYALGQSALARTHLEQFLHYYQQDDGWRRNAIEVLQRLVVTRP
ncbi:MAG: hypothetical protein ACREMV_00360 [Gemmatimonadales bacterium]